VEKIFAKIKPELLLKSEVQKISKKEGKYEILYESNGLL
jgi:hypothetical protein